MFTRYRLERRKNQRLQINLSVIYNVDGPDYVKEALQHHAYEAKTIDLSVGGCSLLAGHYLPRETDLFLKFIMFESDHTGKTSFYELFSVLASICEVIPEKDMQYRYCMSFQNVNYQKERVIKDILMSPLKYAQRLSVGASLTVKI